MVAHSVAVEELPASSQAPSQMSGAGRGGMDEVASQPMFFFFEESLFDSGSESFLTGEGAPSGVASALLSPEETPELVKGLEAGVFEFGC